MVELDEYCMSVMTELLAKLSLVYLNSSKLPAVI